MFALLRTNDTGTYTETRFRETPTYTPIVDTLKRYGYHNCEELARNLQRDGYVDLYDRLNTRYTIEFI
jgi:hypothetical protein